MLKRTVVSIMFLAAMGLLALVPASDSSASGGLAVNLSCEPEPNGAICFGTPSGSGNTFQWSTTENLYFNASGPNSPIAFVHCYGFGGRGMVTVTVTASNGDSGSASRYVRCGPLW